MVTKKKEFESVPKGFFSFTDPQKKRKDLDDWIDHFRKLKIQTAIVKSSDGEFMLCRKGKEVV